MLFACSITRDMRKMIPSPSSHPPVLFPPPQRGFSYGFWEKPVLGDWARQGQTHPEYETAQFHRVAFRLSKPAFNILWHRYCAALSKQNTIMRSAIPVAKRLAVLLDWAGSGSPHQTLARTYDVSMAAVCNIIHEVVFMQRICAKYDCFSRGE